MHHNGQQWTHDGHTMDNNGQQWTTMDNNGQQWTTIRGATCISESLMPFFACQMSKVKSQMIKYQMHNAKSVDLVRSQKIL